MDPRPGPQPPRQWYCNAEFDLTLAHGGGKMPAKILESARGMAWHFWPALARDDSLLVPAAPPEGFLEYLLGLDLSPPRFVTTRDPAATFTPFGWNEEAIRQNQEYLHPSDHSDLASVRRVNSRAYGLELERTLFPEDAEGLLPSIFCATPAAVKAWLGNKGQGAAGRFVAKGNHGHAGIGQLRFERSVDGTPDSGLSGDSSVLSSKLARLAARHGGLVIEPELRVVREWGLLFHLNPEGGISGLRRHRLLSGPAGGYAGALVLPEGAPEAEWAPHGHRAGEALRRISAALHRDGYFGPVGIDIFTHRVGDRVRLRRLVDLNARHSMALPAHGLAERFPEKAVLVRQFSAGDLRSPGANKEFRAFCDRLSFDSGSRRGTIRLTPLLNFSRVSLAFVGESEADVIRMQDEFLARGAGRV